MCILYMVRDGCKSTDRLLALFSRSVCLVHECGVCIELT